MEEKKKITVIGATNTDIAGECLFPMVLSDSNIGKVRVSLGGVGHNIALSSSLLGASVSFITAFGDDTFGK
ncbi:MAG: PfkB family carbohydrate kinase, partial [Candidatus Ornithospirochaeta sp.]